MIDILNEMLRCEELPLFLRADAPIMRTVSTRRAKTPTGIGSSIE